MADIPLYIVIANGNLYLFFPNFLPEISNSEDEKNSEDCVVWKKKNHFNVIVPLTEIWRKGSNGEVLKAIRLIYYVYWIQISKYSIPNF